MMKSNHNRHKRQPTRFSKFILFTFLGYGMITITLGSLIYLKYQRTQEWTLVKMKGQTNSIPPEFAKNNYNLNMVKAINQLTKIQSMVKAMQTSQGLTNEDVHSARKALKQSQSILKRYHVKGGQSYQTQQQLAMYVNIYNFKDTAYQNVDSNQLGALIGQLVEANLTNKQSLNTTLLNQLNQINHDYNQLNQFLNQTLPQLGTIKHGIFTVNTDINQNQTQVIEQKINRSVLNRFTNLQKLTKLLQSDEWQAVLTNNQNLSKHQKWLMVKKIYDTLSQTQYVNVDTLQTYGDVKNYHITFHENIENQADLLNASPITAIYIDGQKVQPHQYIKKSAPMEISIIPSYQINTDDNAEDVNSAKYTFKASNSSNQTSDSSSNSSSNASSISSTSDSQSSRH